MTRDMLVRIATLTLANSGIPDAERHANTIAAQLDMFAQVMGGSPMTAQSAPPASGSPKMSFPPPSPEAVVPVPQADIIQPAQAWTSPAQSLIVTDQRMPTVEERAGQAPPAPTPAPPRTVGRMKVEDLNAWLQQNTPPRLVFSVPVETGGNGRAEIRTISYERNVISRHSHDSVQLVYHPPNATLSVREATEVIETIHVEDAPTLDIPQILKRLAAVAAHQLSPHRIREVPVRPFSGPVQTSSTYEDGSPATADQATIQQVTGVPFKYE